MTPLCPAVAVPGLTLAAAVLVREGVTAASSLVERPSRALEATSDRAEVLCLAVAGLGAGVAGLWLGLVLLVWALDLILSRRSRRPVAGGMLRPRLVRGLLGAVVLCGVADPGSAAGDLPLPVRPLTTEEAAPPRTPDAPHTVRVEPGDCLWRLAAAELGPRASLGQIAQGWRRLYAANRQRIGPDPDLLQPGTTLRVPDLHPSTSPTTGGHRP